MPSIKEWNKMDKVICTEVKHCDMSWLCGGAKPHIYDDHECGKCPHDKDAKCEPTSDFCRLYKTVKEAKTNCECSCDKPHTFNAPYSHCNYGNCCGYKCNVCGKFEVI
jgi:hypothetical protein